MSITQDDNEAELPEVEERFQNQERTVKICRICPFCGQKIKQNHNSNINHHFNKTEKAFQI